MNIQETLKHVYSHQDDHHQVTTLSWDAQLNVMADSFATKGLGIVESVFLPVPMTSYVYHVGKPISGDLSKYLRENISEDDYCRYIRTKFDWDTITLAEIHWDALSKAKRSKNSPPDKFWNKIGHDRLATEILLHREGRTSSPRCLRCHLEDETFAHILSCPSSTATDWRDQFLVKLKKWLQHHSTPSSLVEEIYSNVKAWMHHRSPTNESYQTAIGWESLFCGHSTVQWSYVNESADQTPPMTGDQWQQQLIAFIVNGTYDAWKVRNTATDDAYLSIAEQHLRSQYAIVLDELYALEPKCYLHTPFRESLDDLKRKPSKVQGQWITTYRNAIIKSHQQYCADNHQRQTTITDYFSRTRPPEDTSPQTQ